MMKEAPTTTPGVASEQEPEAPKDPEVERLAKETARVRARQELVEAKLEALGSLATGVTDGPTNTVTFGAKAGSLAPWLAQGVLADVAARISRGVWEALYRPLPVGGPGGHVVFVTDDPELLATDVVSRQVQAAITGRTSEASAAVENLTAAGAQLPLAVASYQREEEEREEQRQQAGSSGTRELLRSTLAAATQDEAEPAEEPAESAPATASTAGGPLAAAIDLVRLLAVDYKVVGREVTVDSALLARLTAGQLAKDSLAPALPKPRDLVLLDGLAPAHSSSTLTAYSALIEALTRLADAVQDLGGVVAPVAAEAAVYRRAVEALEKPPTEGATAEVGETLDELRKRLTAREAAAAPAQGLIAAGAELLAAGREELAALAAPDAAGISPLQRACSRDRLHDSSVNGTRPVTHVLLVEATHAGADIVTRRSILGASGRVGYLGGANGAWVMIDTHGVVFGGGAVDGASHMTHDIATGESRKNPLNAGPGKLTSTDPLEANEKWIRGGVLVLAVVLVVLAVAGAWSVFVEG